MKPAATEVGEALSPIPFLNSGLKSELTAYMSRAADTDPPLEWWKLNVSALPNWSASCEMVFFFFLLQPSSAASERFFSLLIWRATGPLSTRLH